MHAVQLKECDTVATCTYARNYALTYSCFDVYTTFKCRVQIESEAGAGAVAVAVGIVIYAKYVYDEDDDDDDDDDNHDDGDGGDRVTWRRCSESTSAVSNQRLSCVASHSNENNVINNVRM